MYITHYYPQNTSPFSRITQYSGKERNDIVELLSSMSGSALSRFKNFDYYYQRRLQTEKWLYQNAQKMKINTVENSPWYFVLEENHLMHTGFGPNAKFFRIDLDYIDSSDITFTIGDSISIFFSSQAEKIVYNKDSILDIYLNKYYKVENIYKVLQPQHQYIEAQLWTNKYFNISI